MPRRNLVFGEEIGESLFVHYSQYDYMKTEVRSRHVDRFSRSILREESTRRCSMYMRWTGGFYLHTTFSTPTASLFTKIFATKMELFPRIPRFRDEKIYNLMESCTLRIKFFLKEFLKEFLKMYYRVNVRQNKM